jgi:ribosomal protein S6--L-glutamate ligase
MKAAIISLGSTSSKWISQAMSKYFDEVDDIDIREIEVNLGSKYPQVLYKGKPLGEYDCVYGKSSFRYSAILNAITSLLYKTTYMPIKQEAFSIVHDKLLTHLDLQKHNIPMPETYLSSTIEAARGILKKVNYPIIMKFPQGTQGKGVMVADSFPAASSILDALDTLKQPFIIQEYIETEGTDIRTIVVGDRVVAAMERKAQGDEKRSNIHIGGKGEPVELDAHTKKISIETAKVLGAEICAVDILQSHKGPLVIEANISPGLQGITKATNIDIADKIAKYLYLKTKEFTAGKKSQSATKILEDLGIKDTNEVKQIITNLDMRGNRLLLPEVITEITKLDDKEEVILRGKKNHLYIKKFNIEK